MKRSTGFLLLLLTVGHAHGETWDRTADAAAACRDYRKVLKVPGLAVAVAKNGKVVFAQGFGFSDVAQKKKASAVTRFRLASISKAVTSILVKELWQGDQHLQKARKFLPDLPANHKYSIRDLLCHQAGIRHYAGLFDPTRNVNKHYKSARQAIKLFITDKLVGHPGQKFSYSTHGYTVLAAAIEGKTNKNFPRYARSRFRKWGVNELEMELTPINQANRSQIYTTRGRVSRRDDISWKGAGGGMQCSARDLCRLGVLLADGKILPQHELSRLWVRQKLVAGKRTGYGLGWAVGQDKQGRKMVAHSGSQNGANSYWRIYPQHRVVVVVLSNRSRHKPQKLGNHLGRLAFATTSLPIPKW